MNARKKRIVLSAGGTGGHVFPALALAKELRAQGMEAILFTDHRGYQFRDSSLTTLKLPAVPFRGGILQKAKSLLGLMKAISQAFFYLRKMKPDAVIGFGGYASLSTLLAASLLRLNTTIHQSDAYFGRTNRVLSPLVTRIATSFPYVENIPSFCRKKVTLTGLPIRPEMKAAPYTVPTSDRPFNLLVTGGSQGARIFGDILPEAVALLKPDLQENLYITQQCRSEHLKETIERYKKTYAHVELSPFLENMGKHYKQAHLVISRAGASSVIEAAFVGRPALFVPYPHAMDDHQFYNAQQAVTAGGGWIIRESEFTPQAVADFLTDVIIFPWKLRDAAVNIHTIAIPDAPARLAKLL